MCPEVTAGAIFQKVSDSSPSSWARTQGFQKEKVKLSRNPFYKYWWGSCGELRCVERCCFHLENATRKELNSLENPGRFVRAEHLRTWRWVVKCFINIVTRMEPPWKGISIQQRYIYAYMVYFGRFSVVLTSSSPPGICRCAGTMSVLQQDQTIGAVADQ